MPPYLIGIDVGTTGSKAVLIDADGSVKASITNEYPMYTPYPAWSEQDPSDWWTATIASIRQALERANVSPQQVAGVGLTGQMHGLVALDAQGQVLRRCIMWNDQRTAPQCAAITQQVGIQNLLRWTGNPVLPGFTAPKILWVRDNEPEVYRRIAKVLLPKDYVRYCLTGGFFSDVSDASGTSLFDVGQRRWSDDMLKALDIPYAWLPEVTESPVVSARINAEAAKLTGLLEGTPVVGGGGDNAAANVGVGVIREGIVSVSLGTSGVVFAASDTYRVEPEGKLHAFCHAVPGMWHLMGVMLSAAGSFRWFRDALGDTEMAQAAETGRDVYDILTEKAAAVPAGCEGLLFLPYLTGERTPYPDPDARGVFFGLSLRHRKPHLTRAVLEGVSYGLRDSLELMKNLGLPIHQIVALGGGARSALWRQILADVFSMGLVTVNVTEGAPYGAALLAGVGAGVYPDVATACQTVVRVSGETGISAAAPVYADYYPRYRALYAALAPEFKALAEVVARHTSGA